MQGHAFLVVAVAYLILSLNASILHSEVKVLWKRLYGMM